jgi:hypothetical protein
MAKRFNSRAKGNGFELKISKILTEAWKTKFVRTPNSGAFKNLAPSDIIPENNADWLTMPYFIECKARQGWHLEQMISSKSSCPVLDWYFEEEEKQVKSRGDKFYDKCMLLIFTKNHDDYYVMYRGDVEVVKADGTYLSKSLTWTPEEDSIVGFTFSYKKEIGEDTEIHHFRILTLKDFLEHTYFDADKERYKEWLEKKLELSKLGNGNSCEEHGGSDYA